MGEIELNQESLRMIIDLVYKHTGVTMSDKKKNLIQSRIRWRIRELSLSSYYEYIDYLNKNLVEVDFFIDSVTTHETYFFRTPRVWDFFNQKILDNWFKNNPKEVFKVWSAASSSGEEAYSIVISLLEFQIKNPAFKFEVYASDISKDIISQAQGANYSSRSVEGIRKYNGQWYDKYVIQQENSFTIKPEVKKYVKFYNHNLFLKPPVYGFNLFFLRNVLIYFNDQDQVKVLNQVSQSMVPGGMLILGESESITRLDTDLKFIEPLVYQYG